MKKPLKFDFRHKPLDTIFILVLLCVFAFGSLMIVMFGANIYAGVTTQMDTNFNLRTPLSYIAEKVRQHDEGDNIRIVQKEKQNALVLQHAEGDKIYETWIYAYNDKLYELYIEQGTSFKLQDGMEMIPSNGLAMSLSGNLLTLKAYDKHGQSLELKLALRSSSVIS